MTKTITTLLTISLLISIFPKPLNADMAADLTNMLGTYGTMQNSTNPGAYYGQTQNYLSGGAMSVRLPPRTDLNLLAITPPSIRGGCGGIDIALGGLAYLKPQQLVQKIQNFVSNAPATLFFVALQTLTPELATIQGMMEDITHKINSLNLDSCKASQEIVSKGESWVGGYFEESKDKCLKRQQAIGLSQEEAQTACINGSGANAPVPPDGSADSVVHNFTYEAIKSKDYFNDPVLTQQILSVIGTVVYTNSGAGTSDLPEVQVTPYGPILDIETLLNGTNANDASYYVCANTIGTPVNSYVCQDIAISTNNNVTGLKSIVTNQLNSILGFISTYPNNGTTLSQANINFINNNWLPIYTYLNAISMNPALSTAEFPMVADVMTRIIFRQYMEEVLRNLNAAFATLGSSGKGGAAFDAAIKDYRNHMAVLQQKLNDMPGSNPKDIFYVYERIKTVTEITMQRFPKDIVANLSFGQR
jgi:conjugative transfer pilus assembly protein TraH